MAKPEVYGDFQTLTEFQKKFDTIHTTLHEENLKWEKIMLEVDELEIRS